ncbi:MAG TPA: hypothetical protein VHH88_06265 [Verrucomicrobiae bacterium]|nr:hypothetical protein [Verrucomicrobiae bacterium]
MPKIAAILAVVIVVVIIGVAVGWWGSARPKPGPLAPVSEHATTSGRSASAKANAGPPQHSLKESTFRTHRPSASHVIARNAGATSATNGRAGMVSTNFIPNWEDKVDEILVSTDTEDIDKVKQMAAMFPNLSPDAQEEVAHHLSNLTPDEDYTPLAQFLTNSTLSADVLDVFFEDVLNRPNSIKLPLLLQIAEEPKHPDAAEAKDVLALFLENDYGNDWPTWQTQLQQWLHDNPD